MSRNILEGLKANTLDHLILPMLSIDEYESKIDDKRVIVVGFFVFDKDPADDLATFVDKSTSKVLDTEVSPAPTPEGYYVVFVEIMRNNDFPKVLSNILKEVENLCDIKEWQMQCPGHSEPLDVTDDSIQQSIILDQNLIPDTEPDVKTKNKKKKAKVSESLDFWKESFLDNIKLDGNRITFIKNNQTWEYQISKDIPISNINLLETQAANILQSLLGPAYNVYQMSESLVVEHDDAVKVLKIIA